MVFNDAWWDAGVTPVWFGEGTTLDKRNTIFTD